MTGAIRPAQERAGARRACRARSTTRVGSPRIPRGFALLAVLWVMTGVAVLVLMISLAGREAQSAARNRVALTRAAWLAEGCAERARGVIDEALRSGERATPAWRALDSVVAAARTVAGCDVTVLPAGLRLDVNSADTEQLHALLAALGIDIDRADSLVDAILDWRDSDTIARARGAERGWYRRSGRMPPRDGPFAAAREVERVRGVDAIPALDSLLDVDPARILIDRAPPAVLASLPGVGPEALARLAEWRHVKGASGDLRMFAASLSPPARDALLARYQEVLRRTTVEPDAWMLTSAGVDGTPPVEFVLELRLVRAGPRAAVVRRRSWP